MLRGKLIEVFEAPVICVNDLAGYIARTRGAVERHYDARVVLLRITVHMLACRAGHEQMAGLVPGFNTDNFRLVEEHAIGNDLRFEPGGAELARDELGGFVILRRCGEMRLSGEGLEFLAGQFGVGHGEELFFKLRFRSEISKAKASLRDGLRR